MVSHCVPLPDAGAPEMITLSGVVRAFPFGRVLLSLSVNTEFVENFSDGDDADGANAFLLRRIV
jgi:hypothetical protein